MKLGTIIGIIHDKELEYEFEKVAAMGFGSCQIHCWEEKHFTEENANKIIYAKEKYKIEVTALWCGWPGPGIWDFYDGPSTLGLVPSAYRYRRMEALLKGSDFARKIGVADIATHAGFIPEDPNNPDYQGVICAIRYVAQYFKNNGQFFLFETGQETPVTLKRAIEDIGLDNLGVNYDPANLLLYGKANPVDGLDILGGYVRGVHAKDGEYPVNGKTLGEEKPLGTGRVNFPAFIKKLKGLGYNGALTIEREINGEEQIRDIKLAKQLLERLIDEEE